MHRCLSIQNRPCGYWFTARPCYGAVGTHPTGMLSCSHLSPLKRPVPFENLLEIRSSLENVFEFKNIEIMFNSKNTCLANKATMNLRFIYTEQKANVKEIFFSVAAGIGFRDHWNLHGVVLDFRHCENNLSRENCSLS